MQFSLSEEFSLLGVPLCVSTSGLGRGLRGGTSALCHLLSARLFAAYHTAPEQEPGLICSLELPKDSALMGSCMSQSVQVAVTRYPICCKFRGILTSAKQLLSKPQIIFTT